MTQRGRDPKPATSAPTWLPPALLGAALAWLAFREAGSLSIGDVWWHLRTGDLILSDGPPRQDPFSWTAGGETWRPNAWLGDVLWAGTRSLAGAAGVSLLTGLAVFAIAFALYRHCRVRGAGPWACVASAATAVSFMAPFIVPRPLLLGLVLVPFVMEMSARYRSGEPRALAWVAALVVLWSNFHGSFVVGVGLVAAMAAGWAIDDRTLARPAAMAGVAFGAGVLNPYGFTAYVQTLVNRSESVTIEEWQPLALDDSRGLVIVAFMLITAAALAMLIRRGAAAPFWETLLPVAGLAAASILMIRMAPFFLLVAAPVVATALSQISAPRLRRWAGSRTGPLVTGLAVAAVVVAAQQVPQLADAGKPSPQFSEELTAAIPAGCRLLNEYELGGFIIDRRWPDVLVAQDGRADLYGLDRLVSLERLMAEPDVEAIEARGIDCVVAGDHRPLTAALAARPDWTVAEQRSGYTLFVRT